jgi:mono/diheme cytochrome c family protein
MKILMKLRNIFIFGLAITVIISTSSCVHHRASQPVAKSAAATTPVVSNTPPTISTPPVYVPDLSHANDILPDGVLAWDEISKATNAAADQAQAHFTFNFTNVAKLVDRTPTTNITTLINVAAITNSVSPGNETISSVTNLSTVTNITWITNSITPIPVTILSVHPSCGCTTAQLPALPWTIAPGTNAQIGVTVNLEGKNGTVFKFIDMYTDKGIRRLYVSISILPPVVPTMTDDDRARGVAAAKVDRQAVFKNDCATCHIKQGEGKYGQQLYNAVCAVCHEAEQRATMVPDLHNLKVPTSNEFWRTWIAHGRAGSLMPAFSSAEGGPLTDMQIASLASYLEMAIPSHVPPPASAPPAK